MAGKNGHRIARTPWKPDARGLTLFEAYEFGDQTQMEIAKAEGVSEQAISQRFKKVRDWLAKQAVDSIEEIRRSHTRRLVKIYLDAIRAWKRSLEDAEEISEHTGVNSGTTKKRKGQSGNPALLAQARGALQDIRNIWGVDEITRGEREERENDRPIITVVVATKEQADGIYRASQLTLEHKDAQQ